MARKAEEPDEGKSETPPVGLPAAQGLSVSERMMFCGVVPSGAVDVSSLGSSCKLLSERRGDFTHSEATELLELSEFVVNSQLVDRPLRDAWVTVLLHRMQQGLFHPEWVNIITCVCAEPIGDHPPGTVYRMNGQHTAWARLGMPAEWPCVVRFQRYSAATVADMRLLYATIDGGASRTQSNVLKSLLAGDDGFESTPPLYLEKLAQGLKLWLQDDMSNERARIALDTATIAYLLRTTWHSLALRVQAYLLAAPHTYAMRSILVRLPVVAALFETLGKLPGKGHEFWDVVRDGVGIGVESVHDPRVRCHNMLRETTIVSSNVATGGRNRHTGKRVASGEQIYRWCIHCWNAWRTGEEVRILRPMSGKRARAK